MNTIDVFKDKPFPKWMVSHPIFKDVKKISKVFPGIGLPNCDGDSSIDNGGAATKSAKHLIDQLKYVLGNKKNALGNKKVSKDRQEKLDKCIDLMSQIKKKINKGKKAFISSNNGKVSLTMPDDVVYDDKIVFKKGERLFSVYNKISDMLKDAKLNTLTSLDTIQEFKDFSSNNVPNAKFKIVFSSDGSNGAWDIATMSMRGVQSCQSWEGSYSKALIGSVIDPFVGIIYLTSGSNTKYGSKMMRRCVVRFAVNKETKKPFLFLDNMYPNYDPKVMASFKEFLSNKTQKKFDVVSSNDRGSFDIGKAYLPLSGVRKKLSSINSDDDYESSDIASYQDTRIPNLAVSNKNDKHAYNYNKNSKKKQKRFISNFTKEMVAAIQTIDSKLLPDVMRPVAKKTTEYYNQCALENAGKVIAKEIAKSVDIGSFTNSDLYLRRLYCSYFNNKSTAFNAVKTKVAKDLRANLRLKNFRATQFVSVMNAISPKIDAAMKLQLKELLEAKKAVKQLPLP